MTVAMLNMARKTPASQGCNPRLASQITGEIVQQQKRSVNEHFQAALSQAKHLPHILTQKVKHAQQQGILRSLLAGLKTGSK